MSNVVAFPRTETDKIVWACNCGRLTHFMRTDGEIECARCGVIASGPSGEWRKQLPDAPEAPLEVETDAIKVTDLNSSNAALRRVLGKVNADQTAIVIVLQNDGAVTAWGSIETDDQSDWFDRRVVMAKTMISGSK